MKTLRYQQYTISDVKVIRQQVSLSTRFITMVADIGKDRDRPVRKASKYVPDIGLRQAVFNSWQCFTNGGSRGKQFIFAQ